MSEGLRAENVKAALKWWESNRDGIYVVRTADDQQRDAPIVAAARAWLASQEQTPDYEAAARIRAEQDGFEFDAFDTNNQWAWKIATQTVVDAALVGFHPQSEGDER